VKIKKKQLDPITSFKGDHHFLSNFYLCAVDFGGIQYPSSEHAYQAQKSKHRHVKLFIANKSTPGQATRAGQGIHIREGWDAEKLEVMERILRKKFANHYLKRLLQATGNAELIEGNEWHDTFWGMCNGLGQNQLGLILMKIRKDANEDQN